MRRAAVVALLCVGLSACASGPARSQICATAADPTAKHERCHDSFSADEQQTLTDRLSSFGGVVFVKDIEAIPKGQSPIERTGSVFVWVGPLERRSDRWTAGGGMTCGGLCGRGGTYVLVHDEQGWHVQGNAPGTGTWIS